MNSFEQLAGRLAKLQPTAPRQWGRMTAHQMICHLSDSFRLAAGERPVSSRTSVLSRTLVKWIALHTSLPWPRGVRTRPEADQHIGGTRPVEFERDRAELLALMQRFVSEPPAERPRHPIFDRMTESEWMVWGYRHVDHHLRQFGV